MRRVVLVLLAVVVLLPSMARASALFRCAQDGETRSACCCPPKAKHHEAPASAEIHAACCCKITQLKAAESSVRAAPSVAIDMAPAVVLVAIVISPRVAPIRVASIEYEYAPRGPPDPLFVRHCALLL